MRFGENKIASGSGFIVKYRGTYLVTARHNLTGRDQNTDICISPNGGIPNKVVIECRTRMQIPGTKDTFAAPVRKINLDLYKDESPQWLEHPILGKTADIAVIPLNEIDDAIGFDIEDEVVINYGDKSEKFKPKFEMMDSLVVCGYPFGQSSGNSFPIWCDARLASEYYYNIEGKPIFFVDCRARMGQSGSAVFHWSSEFRSDNPAMSWAMRPNKAAYVMGVYSGRINKESDIGIVWKISCVRDIIDATIS